MNQGKTEEQKGGKLNKMEKLEKKRKRAGSARTLRFACIVYLCPPTHPQPPFHSLYRQAGVCVSGCHKSEPSPDTNLCLTMITKAAGTGLPLCGTADRLLTHTYKGLAP